MRVWCDRFAMSFYQYRVKMNYETFTFEKVSIDEARAAHKGDEAEWINQRQPVLTVDQKLQNHAASWLMSLPESVRPLRLARQFPRIVNTISTEWKRPNVCDKVFDDLTIDHRGNRKGFPLEVMKEISDLKAYYEVEVHKRQKDSWSISI